MENEKKISFRQKNPTKCPVCGHEFHREEMYSGGGRLIAGKITDELRREYQVSQKFGAIYPLAYLITVCPVCLYAAYPRDFDTPLPDEINSLREQSRVRKNTIAKFFDNMSFENDRDLALGAASYLLAVDCYNIRNKKVAPTFKIAVSSIRAAWLFDDLANQFPDKQYKKISLFFYKKTYDAYLRVLDLLQNGEEPADAAGNMGPDSDKNWGYEGILYMSAILTVKVGIREQDPVKRAESFEKSKRYLSRLFGAGKTSKNRPTELLDKTRLVYDKINEQLETWKQESQSVEE